jgi:hypothetical protein
MSELTVEPDSTGGENQKKNLIYIRQFDWSSS